MCILYSKLIETFRSNNKRYNDIGALLMLLFLIITIRHFANFSVVCKIVRSNIYLWKRHKKIRIFIFPKTYISCNLYTAPTYANNF